MGTGTPMGFVLAGWFLAALPAAGSVVAAGPAAVSVDVRNPTGQAIGQAPVTFGQAFRKGDITEDVVVSAAGREVPAQVDVKRRYDDGSVRFAVISAILADVPAGGVRLALANGKPTRAPGDALLPAALLKTDFDAVVTLTFPDGAVRSASARQMLERAAEAPATWLKGPVAAEWLLAGPLVDGDGKADPDLHVRFQVRAYAGCRRARVSVVVENCWDHWAGNIRYDAAVRLGRAGAPVFEKKAVDHRRLSRWRKTFWWGGDEPALDVVHDLTYLSASGALPHYDTTLRVAGSPPGRAGNQALAGPAWEIMGNGSLTRYMPTTGGRPEIGPYPAWTARYLLSMDPRAKALVLANGDLAGSWPIHVRNRATGRPLTLDDRPLLWFNGYRDNDHYERPRWQPDRTAPADEAASKFTPDCAHQGSFAYVPYLVTGDFYYLEEAYFWANYCLLAQWTTPRQDGKGLVTGDQIRGQAWALRNIGDAGWIAPDDHPEARHFAEKIRTNIAHLTARMYGPPEYNAMGFWGIRTTQDARIQNPPNPQWMITAPWEHDYLIWSLHHLVELGYPEAARPRDFELRWRVGTLTNAPAFDPMLATPYRFVVGERGQDGKVLFYEDWAQLGRENARLNGAGGLPNYSCSYAYSARGALVCAVDGGFPKAREALAWLEAHLPGHREIMAADPLWGLSPGGAAAR